MKFVLSASLLFWHFFVYVCECAVIVIASDAFADVAVAAVAFVVVVFRCCWFPKSVARWVWFVGVVKSKQNHNKLQRSQIYKQFLYRVSGVGYKRKTGKTCWNNNYHIIDISSLVHRIQKLRSHYYFPLAHSPSIVCFRASSSCYSHFGQM